MDLQRFKQLSQEEAFAWASQHSGVPSEVIDGLWQVESGRGKNMRSPAGARGHFQLMPRTQALFEKKLGVTVNPDDFHESLFLAADHLKEDMRREKGDVYGALRAYNNGPNWRKQKDPRGENAVYADKVLAAAGTKRDTLVKERVTQDQRAQLGPNESLADEVTEASDAAKAEFQRKEGQKVTDLLKEKWGDARENALEQMIDVTTRPSRDPSFSYFGWDGREELEKNATTREELLFLRENTTSPDSGQWALKQLEEYRRKDKLYADFGTGANLTTSLGVGLADPVGWAVGLGAGKMFNVGRAGVRAASAARRGLNQAGRMAGEGALGNIAWEGIQDVSGQVKSLEDYALAGAFGVAFTAPFMPTAIRRAVVDAGAEAAVPHIQAARDAIIDAETDLSFRSRTADVPTQVQAIDDVVTGSGPNRPPVRTQVIPDDIRAILDDAPAQEATTPVAPITQGQATQVAGEPMARPVEPPRASAVDSVDGPSLLSEITTAETRLADAESRLQALDRDADPAAYAEAEAAAASAREDVYRLEAEAEAEAPTFYAPRTENIETTADAESRELRPVAEESLGNALTAARESIGARAFGHLKDALDMVLRFGDPEALQNTVVRYGDKNVDGSQVRGTYRPTFDEIVAPGDKLGGAGMNRFTLPVLVHEAFHAVTVKAIARAVQRPDLSTPRAVAAVKRLDDIRTELRAEMDRRGMEITDGQQGSGAGYATWKVEEFVSQAVMDPETQGILASMKGKKYGEPSLWDRFIRSVFDLLGFPKADPETALYETLKLIETVVRTQGKLPEGITLRESSFNSGVSPQQQSSRDHAFAMRMYDHARLWEAQNPIDPNKVDTLAQRATTGGVRDTLVSDGLKMATSKNPIIRMLSGLLPEITTGAAGRRSTAAIQQHLYHHRVVGSAVNDFDRAYADWRGRNGGSIWGDLKNGEKYEEFSKATTVEILNRRYGIDGQPDPAVRAAADSLQGLYQRSLDLQKSSATLGSAFLPEDAVGYTPQALKGDALRSLTDVERSQLADFLAGHWGNVYGWDYEFASTFSQYYLRRAQRRAAGEKNVDIVATEGATAAVKDTLEEMRLESRSLDARARAQLETVGLQPQNKARLDVDLLHVLPNGKRVLDYYQTNAIQMARQHSRRVAGAAALADFGVLGQRGANNLLRAVDDAPAGKEATKEERDAVERLFAEFLGVPWQGERRNRLASGAGALVRLQRMGGLAFTQLSETANGLHHLGLSSVLEAIGTLPRMISEVKNANAGKSLANPWLGSVDQYQGFALGTEQFRMASAFDPPDQLLREYGKGSNVLERLLNAGNFLQSKVSFFRGLHAAQHRAFAEQIVKRAIGYIEADTPQARKFLDDMGFTPALRAAVRKDLKHAVQRDAAGNPTGFDITRLESVEAQEDFVQAVHRGTAQIIQDTFIGERGGWAHSDMQTLAFQLRTFGLTAMEKQWARTRMVNGPGVEGYAFAAGVLLAQMALVLPVYFARLQVNAFGREDRDEYINNALTPAALVQVMMNYSSMGGLSGDAFDLMASMAGGWNDDAKATLGVRSFATGVGGLVPVLGTADAGLRLSQGKGDVAFGLKQLPFSNLPYLQPIINATR